jgi:NitT/TauT family transport system substrate-binding protein
MIIQKKAFWRISALFLFLMIFTATPALAEKITLKLNWVPGGDHCFYFVALEKGFYKANGLDVNIERGRGSGDTVKRVELGTVDVGLADTGTLVVGRSKGAKVKSIAMIYSNSPNGIKTAINSGIKQPKDLEGHKVGVPAGDAQRVLWPALAKANNVDMNKVTLVNIKPGAKAQSLAAKRVDAVFDWVVGNLQYWAAGMDKDKLVLIPWSKWGVNPYGNSLMANEKTIKERPDMLRKFLDASMKAWQWSIQNPKEAIDIFVKYKPEVPPLAAHIRFVNDIRDLVDVELNQKNKLGWIDQNRMQATVDNINKYFQIERPVTAEEMYTAEFLPDYKMPSIDHLATVADLYQQWKSQKK